jgi:hypothetical protein
MKEILFLVEENRTATVLEAPDKSYYKVNYTRSISGQPITLYKIFTGEESAKQFAEESVFQGTKPTLLNENTL